MIKRSSTVLQGRALLILDKIQEIIILVSFNVRINWIGSRFLSKNSIKGRGGKNAACSVPDLNEGLIISGKVFRLQKRQSSSPELIFLFTGFFGYPELSDQNMCDAM